MTELELLAPAGDLKCGMAAIDHGADAVYIGAERFGARAAAGNSVADIRRLCDYARPFGVRVYVTVNTLLRDDEVDDAVRLIHELYEAGVDAILIQDMRLLEQPLPAIGLHASTQADNRTAGRVTWLREQGFRQVVLARELSADEIAEIHRAVPDVRLEVFVHGALCVSLSGRCYVSEHCFGRSANRGECAQVCRMRFDLLDAEGRVLDRDRYLLSLKDLNLSEHLEELAEAGAQSFKIEGRLKQENYVRNVTAAYSEALDELVEKYPERYRRASRGHCFYKFIPWLERTFNRGYTTYFLHGRQPGIFSADTPKALGDCVGSVKAIGSCAVKVVRYKAIHNGDGLCFLNEERQLVGFRVNRVEKGWLYLRQMPRDLRPGMALYRSYDKEMDQKLKGRSEARRLEVTMALRAVTTAEGREGFTLTMTDEWGRRAETTVESAHMEAQQPSYVYIMRQLARLGSTPFLCRGISIPDDFNYFIPASHLAELRRRAVGQLLAMPLPGRGVALVSQDAIVQRREGSPDSLFTAPPTGEAAEGDGVMASPTSEGAVTIADDERGTPVWRPGMPLMQCRHCLRYAYGFCLRHGGRRPTWQEPLSLRLGNGRTFRLEFDCRRCQMNVYSNE